MSDPARQVTMSFDVPADVWIPLPTLWPDPNVGTKEDWVASASKICARHTKWWNPMGRKLWKDVLRTLVQDGTPGTFDMWFVHVPGRWGRIAAAHLSFNWADLDYPELTMEERLLVDSSPPVEPPIVVPFTSPALGDGIKMSSTHPSVRNGHETQFQAISYAWVYRSVHAVLSMALSDTTRLAEFEPDLDELARSFHIVSP